ncbi:MAG: hypothetical protein SCJ97_09105 [Bacillota bacterium]|nr:hypothetical protein [Bacillota bacterium]
MKIEKRKPSKREKYMLTILLITSFLIIWYLVGAKVYSEIQGLKEEKAQLQKEMDILNDLVGQKKQIESSWIDTQPEMIRLGKAIPPLSSLPRVLSALESLLDNYKNNLYSFKVGELAHEKEISILHLQLSAVGPAEIIHRLLKEFELFPHLLTIWQLEWSALNDDEIKLDLEFNLYFVPSDQEAYTTSKAGSKS